MSRTLALAVVALVLALGCWLVMTPAAFAQEPPEQLPEPTPVAGPTPTPTPEGNPAPDPSGGLLGLLPDPKQWAADVFNQVLVDLLRGLAEALHGAVGTVLGSSLNFITQTPPPAATPARRSSRSGTSSAGSPTPGWSWSPCGAAST